MVRLCSQHGQIAKLTLKLIFKRIFINNDSKNGIESECQNDDPLIKLPMFMILAGVEVIGLMREDPSETLSKLLVSKLAKMESPAIQDPYRKVLWLRIPDEWVQTPSCPEKTWLSEKILSKALISLE